MNETQSEKVEHESERLRVLGQYGLPEPALRPALEDVCRLAIAATGSVACTVDFFLADRVESGACVGLDPSLSPLARVPLGLLLDWGASVRVAESAGDPRFGGGAGAGLGGVPGIGLRSAAGVPLVSPEGTLVGCLTLWSSEPGRFGGVDPMLLGSLGRQAMARLDLVRRERQIQHLQAEHARVDEALREAEGMYRGIFENTVVGIYQTTPDGRYLSANPMLARIYGYATPGELMDRVGNIKAQLYVDPEARDRFVAALQQEDTISNFEAQIYRKDGTVIWIVENARVVRDASGQVRYYEGTVQDITARKQALDQVRNSEVLYHSLVEELPQNVFRKDLRERFIFANTRFCQTVGRSWTELEGCTDFDLFPPELAGKYQADDQRVIAEGKTVRETEANVTPDGETHWVEVIKTPLRDHTGAVAGIQGIFWDVTKTKRLQDELAYERDLLQALLDHIPDSIYFKDPQSRFVKVGRALARRFSVADPEQLVGKTSFDLLDPALARVLHEEEQHLLKTGEPIVNTVEQIIDHQGRSSWASVTKVPIYNRAGKILGLVGVARDITQLIETEQALRDAEEKYRAIFENSVEGIFQTSFDGKFLQANPALARLYGYASVEELIADRKDIRTQVYVVPGRREEFVRQVLLKGSITGFESEIYRRGGTRTWVSESARVVRDREGNPLYFEGTLEDISARKRIEEEQEKARQAALDSVRMKSEFVATVSHEIRTPLNAIVPSSEHLLKTRLDRQQRQFVESIDYGAHMLLQIVNDILEVSRIEAGAITLETIDFDLHDLIERTVGFFATPAHAKRLEVIGRIRPGVPHSLRGDPARLGQVLNNLLGNAIKFTERGEVVLSVELLPGKAGPEDVELRFQVRDTGIGIAPEARSRVFQPFAQADGSMARRYGGTGLGLTISRRFIELMGGQIDFDSVVGEGTTFHFTVHLKPGTPPATDPAPPPRLMEGLRVLLLDDSAAQREVIASMLETMAPSRVVAVASISEALESMRPATVSGQPFTLVFFDADLPGSDLVQTARRLRSGLARGCRLIALTAPGSASADRGLEAAGIAGTLVKPLRQSRLPAELAAVLSGEPDHDPQPPAVEEPPELPGTGLAVLLVEDNALNQRVAVDLLQRLGADVEAVSSGPQALTASANREYDLILMDCQMPDMDGYETTRWIREREVSEGRGARHVPIVALSANALAGDRERGLAAGMDDYLTKPLRQPDMARILRAVAGRSAVGTLGGEGESLTVTDTDTNSDTGTRTDTGTDRASLGGEDSAFEEEDLILDPAPLEALASPDDPGILPDFIAQFRKEAPVKINLLAVALAAGDAAKLRAEAHSLKGNASYMGARRLVRAAGTLETAARGGDLSGAAETLAEIRREFEAAETALAAFLAGHPPSA